ncbi:hypothetical protein Bca52824_094662 [Brassica carinata]|uniref:Uncharacterized protein n=1 Tax=Brassica carinata TaxID=52824 RepID=A0A8X7P3C5_BRACI|nr:hypothetical protein Bca52824_094662 [Brassica carinata]
MARNGTECPKGTILACTTLNETTGSQPGEEATLGHEVIDSTNRKIEFETLNSQCFDPSMNNPNHPLQ